MIKYLFYIKALKDLLFVSNQVTKYFFIRSLGQNLTSKVNLIRPFMWKILFNPLTKILKRLKKCNYYV